MEIQLLSLTAKHYSKALQKSTTARFKKLNIKLFFWQLTHKTFFIAAVTRIRTMDHFFWLSQISEYKSTVPCYFRLLPSFRSWLATSSSLLFGCSASGITKCKNKNKCTSDIVNAVLSCSRTYPIIHSNLNCRFNNFTEYENERGEKLLQ